MTGVPLHLPEPDLFFFTVTFLTGWSASWIDHQISGLSQLQNHIIFTGSNWTPYDLRYFIGDFSSAVILWASIEKTVNSSVHPQTGGNSFSVPVLQDPGAVRSPGSVGDTFQKSKISGNHGHHAWDTSLQAMTPSSTVVHSSLNSSPGRHSVPVCAQLQMPPFHRDLRLLDLDSWKFSGTFLKSHHSPTLSSIWLRNPSGIPPVMGTSRTRKPSYFGPPTKVSSE